MVRSSWYTSLLAFLREQPAERTTVTLTLAELATLAGQPMPAGALTRTYWWSSRAGAMRFRLGAIGWRVGEARRRGAASITFVRVPPDLHRCDTSSG